MIIKIITFIINFYQVFLSFDRGILAIFAPGGACKFNVSCSEYTKRSIKQSGVLKGSLRSLKRIWRCR